VGAEGTIDPSGLIVASDRMRLQAWASAGAMFVERPLTGQGFLSYRELHQDYGDPVLRSPHNEWIRLFAEEGIVIGLAGLAFLVATAVALARVPGVVGAASLAGFAGWAIAATFNNPTLFIQVGLVAMAVTGAGVGVAWRSRASGRPPARP
jgi:O-antigen ligase